jgi:hypothetical protein
MLTREENELFAKVGPGTPMGEMLRRYWHPIGCSEKVTSKPQRIKVLGEELVLYRGASGAPVLMQLRCAHRSLALAFSESVISLPLDKREVQRAQWSFIRS